MSGFEIIGVVLGGLPLLISAAEDYKEGFEPFLKWRRFRYEFRTFINNVDLEKQMFDALVVQLLEQTELSVEQKQALCMGQDPDGWQRPEIKGALKNRLGDSCDACTYLLKAMEEDFIKLSAMMSLKNGSVDWAKPGEDKWNYQRKRISHSFSKKGSETVISLGEKNRKFKDLLDVLDRKTAPRQNFQRAVTAKDTSWARIFDCIRCQANNLHSVLKLGWRCSCALPHLTALQLQKRTSEDLCFAMRYIPPIDSRLLMTCQRKITITVIEPKGTESSRWLRPEPTPFQQGFPTKISLLRPNFDKAQSCEAMNQKSSMYSSLHPVSMPTMSSNPSSSTAMTKSALSSTQVVMTSTSQRDSDVPWRKSFRKTVRMNLSPQQSVETTPETTTPGDLKPQPQLAPTTPPLEEPAQDYINAECEIEDLCFTLGKNEQSVTRLGFLSDDENRHYQFRSINDNALASPQSDVISLETLLDRSSKPSLSRKQRFRLAVTLASSLLQLQTTPWLPEYLRKEYVFFEYHGRDVVADVPYVHQFFSSTKLPSSPNTQAESKQLTAAYATRASLIQLGILLLELCFGEAIESQTELRENNFFEGKAHDHTNYLTALEWISEVEQEAGLEFQDAVRCCFYFDVKPNWTDAKFTQSIYAGVVQPLEKVVSELGWADSPLFNN